MYNIDINEQMEFTFPKFCINTEDSKFEEIYGISFNLQTDGNATFHPKQFNTYLADGKILQHEAIRNCQFELNYESNILRTEVNHEIVNCKYEMFVKKDAVKIEFIGVFFGNTTVKITDINFVKGGFPGDTIIKSAPYILWINNLDYNINYEKSVNMHTPSVCDLANKYNEYKNMDINNLLSLIPSKRTLVETANDVKYLWSPLEPDVLIDKTTNELFKPNESLEIAGYDDAIKPSGEIDKYAYTLTPRKWEMDDFFIYLPNYPGPEEEYVAKLYDKNFKKTYVDEYMTSTRINCFFDAATELSCYFKTTNDKKSGIVSACIIATLARYFMQWPMYGRVDFNYNVFCFFPPDSYERWFACFGDGEQLWYTPATKYTINRFVRIYENLKQSDIWGEVNEILGYNGRDAIKDAILYAAKCSLKYDAYYRTDIWKFYHNTIGEELIGLVNAGLSVGCPELIHYSVQKLQAALNYVFMADGMFPEAISYMQDTLNMVNALKPLEGYSDPKEYLSKIDGGRFDNFSIIKNTPLCDKLLNNYATVKFPDGTEVPIHDTWSRTQYAGYTTGNHSINDTNAEKYKKNVQQSYLFTEFGHGVISNGIGDDAVDFHLHFSGKYNHYHHDMLNVILWAYGDELLPDLGYSHIGGYSRATINHNTVTVDNCCQDSEFLSHRGDLIAWNCENKDVNFISASANNAAYKQVTKYKRTCIMVNFSDGNHCILDIFEVIGGKQQEWVISGCADYSQNMQTNLEFNYYKDVLADDGVLFENNHCSTQSCDMEGEKSIYYNAFINAKFAAPTKPWYVDLSPKYLNGEQFNGCGPRGAYKGKKPSLRVHGLCNLSGNDEVIVCDAPRNRYQGEMDNNNKESMENWYNNLMTKIIVRSTSKNENTPLNNTFVHLFEPYKDKSFITLCNCIKNDEQKTVVDIGSENEQFRITYFKSTNDEDTLHLMIVNVFDTNSIVVKYNTTYEKNIILSYAKKYIIFNQAGQSGRFLQIKMMEQLGDNKCKITFKSPIGFTYNIQNEKLRETHFPFRTLYGKATIDFIVNECVTWEKK